MHTRVVRQVKKEEYDEFFKQTFQEFLEPLTHAHFNVEGTYEFSALLFVPGMAPFQQEVQLSQFYLSTLDPKPICYLLLQQSLHNIVLCISSCPCRLM